MSFSLFIFNALHTFIHTAHTPAHALAPSEAHGTNKEQRCLIALDNVFDLLLCSAPPTPNLRSIAALHDYLLDIVRNGSFNNALGNFVICSWLVEEMHTPSL